MEANLLYLYVTVILMFGVISGARNEQSCLRLNSGADRNEYIWGIPFDSVDGKTAECLIALSSPDCQPAPWSRSGTSPWLQSIVS